MQIYAQQMVYNVCSPEPHRTESERKPLGFWISFCADQLTQQHDRSLQSQPDGQGLQKFEGGHQILLWILYNTLYFFPSLFFFFIQRSSIECGYYEYETVACVKWCRHGSKSKIGELGKTGFQKAGWNNSKETHLGYCLQWLKVAVQGFSAEPLISPTQ